MGKPKEKKKKIAKKLLHKYRLVILNEDTFEERLSFKLTRLNVFILVGISAIVLITFTTLLIAFTPLREYIPGYSSTKLKRNATRLVAKADSLENAIRVNEQYYSSIRQVLSGDIKELSFNRDSIRNTVFNDEEIYVAPSKEDSLLREKVAQEDKYNVFDSAIEDKNFALFPPVNGTISSPYDASTKHFAVDIVTKKDAPVKAAADGTVIFAEWTSETGHVLIIEHSKNLITVYKHNASLSKSQGDLVQSGEVIATVGNTGELSTGPHLHFELWSNGYPINPVNFIDFN
ncbi:M23 family metallopeptidase [Dokdonia sp. Hel_I_53]|uniref:M23 family metallopeptidase n=1 Tax=Dokdonia sp. Hel_I_53 TaxID=1566287 RepID=UPI00119BBDA5|nr:M23 family metallopeptidase [Dokdonia sp. Hel_I_53]TVZ52657.1 murein DD-endopeptidase MepM/ murein hydrolase activator NlpD [Dokdonia sp. Hel_I_53]